MGQKTVFVPALIGIIAAIYYLAYMLLNSRRHIPTNEILHLAELVCSAVGYLFLAKWCESPYKIEEVKEEKTVEKTSVQNNTIYQNAYIDMGKHIVLCLFTFGVWYYIWIYRTTIFLNSTPNSEQYDPKSKLLLCLFVPFYSIYWMYKHGQKIDEYLKSENLNSSDMTTICLILGIFAPVVACILMQDKINTICMTKK